MTKQSSSYVTTAQLAISTNLYLNPFMVKIIHLGDRKIVSLGLF